MRIGHGYDAHRLVSGRRLIIGGVEIPHTQGLDGYSDADVLLHALMDALLGAAALGDIGAMFPPGDDAYKDISSLRLLDEVFRRITAEGFLVGNLDCTIIAQQPAMAPHIDAMRKNISQSLAIPKDRVSVKATTEERMGFTGAEEGIAAHAVVLLSE